MGVTETARSQPISVRKYGEGQDKRCQLFCFIFSEHYSVSNILPKDSSKVSYTLKISVSKQFDNFDKRALRVTETGTSRINVVLCDLAWSAVHSTTLSRSPRMRVTVTTYRFYLLAKILTKHL